MAEDTEQSAQSEAGDGRSRTPVEPAAATSSTPKPRGRGLAALSLVLASAALAGAGYLYYQLVYMAPLTPLEARLADLSRAQAASAGHLQALQATQSEALEQLAEQQRLQLAEAEQAVAAALAEATNQAPPAPREWKLAEVEYLLRIANHRLLMERDVGAAQRLLAAADAILADLDNFALHEVRAQLADEMLALRGVQGNDVQGIYLRLEAIKGRLDQLPLALPEYFAVAAAPVQDAPLGFWQQLRAELSQYLKVRRFDGATKPLLAPEERVYLELNLRLMLERAQLATLRRQQLVYEQSLSSTQEWLREYLDPSHAMVQDLNAQLDELLDVQLEQALPSVSGSLSTLLALRRTEL